MGMELMSDNRRCKRGRKLKSRAYAPITGGVELFDGWSHDSWKGKELDGQTRADPQALL